MSIVGNWKAKKMLIPDENGINFLTKEELINKGIYDEDDMGMMFNLHIDINEDGTISSFVMIPDASQLPPEVLESAKAEGADLSGEIRIPMESYVWVEENGSYFYEVDGQKTPLEINEEGLLVFNMGMTLFEKL